jgi:hypothetical protein
MSFCCQSHLRQKQIYFTLNDGLPLFVAYEWVTIFLFLGARTSYVTSSVLKLSLQINASFDQSASSIFDNDQPIVRGFVTLLEVRGGTLG